jgi:hypothetical protein
MPPSLGCDAQNQERDQAVSPDQNDRITYSEALASAAVPLTASVLYLAIVVNTSGSLRWPSWLLVASLVVMVASVVSGIKRQGWPHVSILIAGACLLGTAVVVTFFGNLI